MFGQRDEATMIAFAEALAFQTKVGRAAIEQRSKALAQQLLAGLAKIDGFRSFTSTDPARNGAVVTFAPGTLEPRKLVAALYEKDQIGGHDRWRRRPRRGARVTALLQHARRKLTGCWPR